jgi:exonuclease III
MRVVSWNIRAGGGHRVPAIVDQIARWQPDVVALSEFRATPPSAEVARALAGRGLVHQLSTASPRLARVNGLLIASRWPIERVRLRSAPVAESGRWLLARLAGPFAMMIGAMHVPNRVTGRKLPFLDAVLSVAHSWRRGPALLLGDTNSGLIDLDEESSAFDVEEDGWIRGLDAAGWADAFRRLWGDERAYTWYSPNGGNGFRIDQAFVNRALQPRLLSAWHEWGVAPSGGSRLRRDALSDHAALLVDFDARERSGTWMEAPSGSSAASSAPSRASRAARSAPGTKPATRPGAPIAGTSPSGRAR